MTIRRRGSVKFKSRVVPIKVWEPPSLAQVMKSDPKYGFMPISQSVFEQTSPTRFGYRFPHPGIITNIRVMLFLETVGEQPEITVRLNDVAFYSGPPLVDTPITGEPLDVDAYDLLVVDLGKCDGVVMCASLVCDYAYHIV